jgi:hypothetical protein
MQIGNEWSRRADEFNNRRVGLSTGCKEGLSDAERQASGQLSERSHAGAVIYLVAHRPCFGETRRIAGC